MKKEPVTKFDKHLLAEKLVVERKRCGLTRDDVIRLSKTGLSRSSLQEWESAKREPKLGYIYDLAEIYGIHPWELLSGEKLVESDSPAPTESANDEDSQYIPHYALEASAGHGSFIDNQEPDGYEPIRKDWIRSKGLQADKLVIINTKGDSMEPTIPEGASVIIDTSLKGTYDGKIYVISIDDRLYVKRVQWLPQGGIRLISDNKYYQAIELTKEDLQSSHVEICGQVIHTRYDL